MKKALTLVIFMLIGLNLTFAQNRYDVTSRVKVSDIKNKSLEYAFSHLHENSFLKLPIYFNSKVDGYSNEQFNEMAMPYPYEDRDSLFYANLDRRNKNYDNQRTLISLIKETNGNYIWGIVTAFGPGCQMIKEWLVTFDLSGEMIDYLLICERPGEKATIVESQINRDFTVDVQRLDFPDNDYIFQNESFTYVQDLKGQRIDSKYQVTPEGKFKIIEEIRYQPQIYTPEMLREGKKKQYIEKGIAIRQRNEKRM